MHTGTLLTRSPEPPHPSNCGGYNECVYRNLPAWDDLYAVVLTAEHESISATARDSHIHQQTLSQRINRAENTLGIEIFHRSPYGIALTAAGRSLLPHVRTLLAHADEFEASRRLLARTPAHVTLTIAVSNTVAELYSPAWIATFTATHPHVSITQLQDNSAGVRKLVAEQHADVGVVEGGTPLHNEIEKELGSDELVLTVTPDHPWAKRDNEHPVTAAELRTTPLVVREKGSGSRDVIENVLGTLSPPAGEFGSLASQRSGIMALKAPGIIAKGAIADHIQLGRLIAVPAEVTFTRPLTAVWLRHATRSKEAKEFIDSIVLPA